MNFKKAFTMIELIFVIVVIGILAAIAVPKLEQAKHEAERIDLNAVAGDVREAVNKLAKEVANNTEKKPLNHDTSFDDTVRIEE